MPLPDSPTARIGTVTVAVTLLIAGCSGNKTQAPPPSASSSSVNSTPAEASAAPAPGGPSGSATRPAPPPPPGPGQLDGGACLKLTGATLNLVSGTSAEDNRKAADAIESFNPPDNVREAVEHFVGTNGLQQSDPKKNEYSRAINNWVEKVCPV